MSKIELLIENAIAILCLTDTCLDFVEHIVRRLRAAIDEMSRPLRQR